MERKGCVWTKLCRLLGVVLLIMIFPPYDVTAQSEDIREYCEDSTFEGRCADDEVIVMKTARYGRMRTGTCLLTDYGHQGCSRDVVQPFDRWCSGRPTCDVEVSDLLNKVTQPCPKDLRNYLEASYTCFKVIWPTVQRCISSSPLITEDSGFLSNYVTEKTSCGNIDYPWIIRVPKGQQINLTLYDFAYHPSIEHPNICQVLAVIKDRGTGANTATKTVCNGARREDHLMTSQTNEVEIRFVLKTKPNEDGRYHIVHFKAIGCPDLDQPSMWFHRTLSTARVGCEGGDDSWQLVCQGNEWKGQIPDCTTDAQPPQNVIMDATGGVPYGVSVAIILAIALMIGAVILTVGLVVIRRRRNRNPSVTIVQRDHSKMSKDDCYVERIPYTDHGGPGQGYHPGDNSPYNGENTYYRTWELQRHAPHGATMMHGPGAHACAAASVPPGYQGTHMREDSPPQYLEHIYESPKSVRKDIEAMTASDSLKYYELDPSMSDGKRPKDPDVTS